MRTETRINPLYPVLFGFFIMGFVDIVGVATNYVKNDFVISDTLASLVSVSCFIWFFLCSVPAGIAMNRFGRKKVVLAGYLVNLAAMLAMLLFYNIPCVMASFALLGVGNTLLQVSLNPLVTDVTSPERLTSTLTFGQLVKSVCSFITPVAAALFASSAFGWRGLLAVFGILTLVASVWLWAVPAGSGPDKGANLSVAGAFRLFSDKVILLHFIAIMVLVGSGVGFCVTLPKLMQERFGMGAAQAGIENSVYFLAKSAGALIGGILLVKVSVRVFYRWSIVIALLGLAMMIPASGTAFVSVCVAVFGLGFSNLFAIVMSLALKHRPDRSNEVSALLIMGLIGAALVPPLLGLVSDATGTQTSCLAVLFFLCCYLPVFFHFIAKKKGGK